MTNKTFTFPVRRRLAILVLLALGVDIVLSPLAQAEQLDSVWKGRRRAPEKIAQVALLPGSITPAIRNGLADHLPGAAPSLPQGRWSAHPSVPGASAPLRALLETIPLNAVTVGDIRDGKAPSVPVLVVQDIHLNLEAQRNIAQVIEAVASSGRVDVVGVEGAFGKFDFSPFRQLPRQEIIRRVADAYLKLNRLAAPSYAGITMAKTPPLFIGIDEPVHYRKNVDAYLASRGQGAEARKKLSALKQDLIKEKAAVYSPRLAEFDRLNESYRSGSIPFGVYLARLASGISEPEPVVERFLRAYEMERALDFTRVEQERRRVIESLAMKLSDAELSELLSNSIAYKTGRIGFGVYYTELSKLCESKGVSLKTAPAFDSYVHYVMLADGIRAEELFAAVTRIEQSLVDALATTPAQKALVQLSTHLYLAGQMVDFALSPSEWKTYKEFSVTAPLFTAPEARPLVDGLSAASGLLAPFLNFYAEADARSEYMIAQILSNGSRGRVMVVGGFHAPEITEALRNRGVPYIVVTPRLTKIDLKDGSAYLSVFAREKTPLDRLFQGERLFLAPDETAVGTRNPASAGNGLRFLVDAAVRLYQAGVSIPSLVVRPRSDGQMTVRTPQGDVTVNASMPIGEGFSVGQESATLAVAADAASRSFWLSLMRSGGSAFISVFYLTFSALRLGIDVTVSVIRPSHPIRLSVVAMLVGVVTPALAQAAGTGAGASVLSATVGLPMLGAALVILIAIGFVVMTLGRVKGVGPEETTTTNAAGSGKQNRIEREKSQKLTERDLDTLVDMFVKEFGLFDRDADFDPVIRAAIAYAAANWKGRSVPKGAFERMLTANAGAKIYTPDDMTAEEYALRRAQENIRPSADTASGILAEANRLVARFFTDGELDDAARAALSSAVGAAEGPERRLPDALLAGAIDIARITSATAGLAARKKSAVDLASALQQFQSDPAFRDIPVAPSIAQADFATGPGDLVFVRVNATTWMKIRTRGKEARATPVSENQMNRGLSLMSLAPVTSAPLLDRLVLLSNTFSNQAPSARILARAVDALAIGSARVTMQVANAEQAGPQTFKIDSSRTGRYRLIIVEANGRVAVSGWQYGAGEFTVKLPEGAAAIIEGIPVNGEGGRDPGAQLGRMTVTVSKEISPTARQFSFEPLAQKREAPAPTEKAIQPSAAPAGAFSSFRSWIARRFSLRGAGSSDGDAADKFTGVRMRPGSARLRPAKVRTSAVVLLAALGLLGAGLVFMFSKGPGPAPVETPVERVEEQEKALPPTLAQLADAKLGPAVAYHVGTVDAFAMSKGVEGPPQKWVASNRDDKVIAGWAVFYDNLIFAQMLAAQRTPEALRESAAYVERMKGQWATRTGDQEVYFDQDKKEKVPFAYMNAVRASDGAPTEKWTHSGPMLHLGLASMNIYRMARDSDPAGFAEGRYNHLLDIALQQARYAHSLARVRSGTDPRLVTSRPDGKTGQIWIPFGPVGGKAGDQAFPDGHQFNDIAVTEIQMDAYNLWTGLGEILGNDARIADFQSALPMLENFIFSPAIWNEGANRFNAGWRLWDNSSDRKLPTDIQAWSVPSLSPAVMAARFPGGQNTIEKIFEKLDSEHAVRKGGKADGEIIGYSFVPGQGRYSAEWSAQVAEAKAHFGRYLVERPDDRSKALGAKYKAEADDLILRLAAVAARNNGLYYAMNADDTQAPVYETGVGFPTHLGRSGIGLFYMRMLLLNESPMGRGRPLGLFERRAVAAAPQVAAPNVPLAPKTVGLQVVPLRDRGRLWFTEYANKKTGLFPDHDRVFMRADGSFSFNDPFSRADPTDSLAVFGTDAEAQAAIALLSRNDLSGAEPVVAFFKAELARQKEGPDKRFRGFAHYYTIDGKESLEHRLFSRQKDSGPHAETASNLWIGIMAMHHYRAKKDPSSRALAEEIVNWTNDLNGKLPGAVMGPKAGDANWPRLYSTRDNVLYYSLLRMLVADDAGREATGPNVDRFREELAGVQGVIRHGLTANRGDWQGLPWRGGQLNERNALELEGVRHLSGVAQLLLAAGPEGMKKDFEYTDAVLDQLLRFIDTEFGVSDKTATGFGIVGYDVANADGRKQTGRGPMVFVETSEQMELVLRSFAAHFRRNGNKARADESTARAVQIRQHTTSLQTPQGSYPKADKNLRPFFDSWMNSPRTTGSAVSTAMVSFADGSFNPLALDGVLDPGPSGVTPARSAGVAIEFPNGRAAVIPGSFWERNQKGKETRAVNPLAGEATDFDPDSMIEGVQVPGAMVPLRTLEIGPGPDYLPRKDEEGKEIERRKYASRILKADNPDDLRAMKTLPGYVPGTIVYSVTTVLKGFDEKGTPFERKFTLYYAKHTLAAQKGVKGREVDQDLYELSRIDDSDSVLVFSYDKNRPGYGFPSGYQRYARIPAVVANRGKPAAAEKIELRETVTVEQTLSYDADTRTMGYKISGVGTQAGVETKWTGYVNAQFMVVSSRIGDRVEISILSAGAMLNSITFGWLPIKQETRSGSAIISRREIVGVAPAIGNTISAERTPQPNTPENAEAKWLREVLERYDLMGNTTATNDSASGSVTLFNFVQTRNLRLMTGLGDIGIPSIQIGPDGNVMRVWDQDPVIYFDDAGRPTGMDIKVRDPNHPELGTTVQKWRIMRYPALNGRVVLALVESDNDRERIVYSYESPNDYQKPSKVTREIKSGRPGVRGRFITSDLRYKRSGGVDFDADGNFVYDTVDGKRRYEEHQNISTQTVMKRENVTVGGRTVVREEISEGFDFNNVSGLPVAADTVVRMDGVPVERHRLRGIDRKTGVVQVEVEDLVSGLRQIHSQDIEESVLEILDIASGQVTRYDVATQRQIFKETGQRVKIPTEIAVRKNGAETVVWRFEKAEFVRADGNISQIRLVSNSAIYPQRRIEVLDMANVATYAPKPGDDNAIYVRKMEAGRPVSVENLYFTPGNPDDIRGGTRTTYTYNGANVQKMQIRVSYDPVAKRWIDDQRHVSELSTLNDGTPLFEYVENLPEEMTSVLNARKEPMRDPSGAVINPSVLFRSEERYARTTVTDALGERIESMVDAQGRPIRQISKGLQGTVVVFNAGFVWDAVEGAPKPQFLFNTEKTPDGIYHPGFLDILRLSPDGSTARFTRDRMVRDGDVTVRESISDMTIADRTYLGTTYRDLKTKQMKNLGIERIYYQGKLFQEANGEWVTQLHAAVPGTDLPAGRTLFRNGEWVTDTMIRADNPTVDLANLNGIDPTVRAKMPKDVHLTASLVVSRTGGPAKTVYSAQNDPFKRSVVTENPAIGHRPATMEVNVSWFPASGLTKEGWTMSNAQQYSHNVDVTSTVGQEGDRVMRSEDIYGSVKESWVIVNDPLGAVWKIRQGSLETLFFYSDADRALHGDHGVGDLRDSERFRVTAPNLPLARVVTQGDGTNALVFRINGTEVIPGTDVVGYSYNVDVKLQSQHGLVSEVCFPSGAPCFQRFNGSGWQVPTNSNLYFSVDGYPSFSTADGKLYVRYKVFPFYKTGPNYGRVWTYEEPATGSDVKKFTDLVDGKLTLSDNGFEIARMENGPHGMSQPNAGDRGLIENSLVFKYFIPARSLLHSNPQVLPGVPALGPEEIERSGIELMTGKDRRLTKDENDKKNFTPYNGDVPDSVSREPVEPGWQPFEIRILGISIPWWLSFSLSWMLYILTFGLISNLWFRPAERRQRALREKLESIVPQKRTLFQRLTYLFVGSREPAPVEYLFRAAKMTETELQELETAAAEANQPDGSLDRFISIARTVVARTVVVRSQQASFLGEILLDFREKGLLTPEVALRTVQRMRAIQNAQPNYDPTFSVRDFWTSFIRETFTKDITSSFKDIKYDATYGTPGDVSYNDAQRDRIHDMIIDHLSNVLATNFKEGVFKNFVTRDPVSGRIMINRPELPKQRAGKGGTGMADPKNQLALNPEGADTERSLRTWVWREVFTMNTTKTGMMGEYAGRGRLMNQMMRRAAALVDQNQGEYVLPLVRSNAKFWQALIPDQGQSRGGPNGKLLRQRAVGLDFSVDNRRILPDDLFLNADLDELYRYYPDPLQQFRPELSALIGFTPKPRLEPLDMSEQAVLKRQADDEREWFEALSSYLDSRFGKRTDESVQLEYQEVADVLKAAVRAKDKEVDPLHASYQGRKGWRGLSHLMMPIPIHWSRNGLESFLRWWNFGNSAALVRVVLFDDSRPGFIRKVIGLAMKPVYFTLCLLYSVPVLVAPLVAAVAGFLAIGTFIGFIPVFLGITPLMFLATAVGALLIALSWRGDMWLSTRLSKGASGAPDGKAMRFWMWTFVSWAAYMAALSSAVVIYLARWSTISQTGSVGFVAAAIPLTLFSIVTYPAISMIGVGYVAWKEGRRKRVAITGGTKLEDVVGFFNLAHWVRGLRALSLWRTPFVKIWDWPSGRLSRFLAVNFKTVDVTTGHTYESMWNQLIDFLYLNDHLSLDEAQAMRDQNLEVRPSSAYARDQLKQFVNLMYMEKPGVEIWDALFSQTEMVSAAGDAQFKNFFDRFNAKGSQDWQDTKVHYYTTRLPGDWANLLARLKRDPNLRTPEALAFIDELQNIRRNRPVMVPKRTKEVRAIMEEVSVWLNGRGYSNVRTLDSMNLKRNAWLANVETFYFNEEYQQMKEYLVGYRAVRQLPEGSPEPARVAGLPGMDDPLPKGHRRYLTEREAAAALKKRADKTGADALKPWEIEYLRLFDRYWAEVLEKYQVILREDNLAGQLEFGEGINPLSKGGTKHPQFPNIKKFTVRDDMAAFLEDWEKQEDDFKLAPELRRDIGRGSKGLKGVDFEVFAPYYEDYMVGSYKDDGAVINRGVDSIVAEIKTQLRDLLVRNHATPEELANVDELDSMAVYGLNDYLMHYAALAKLMEKYRDAVKSTAAAHGAEAEITGSVAWKRLIKLAPEKYDATVLGLTDVGKSNPVIRNFATLRDFSAAQAFMQANDMTYFQASKTDAKEGCKYGGWGRALYSYIGQILCGTDAAQNIEPVFASSPLRAMRQFSADADVKMLLTGIYGNTSPIFYMAEGSSASESVWNTVGQRVKELTDILGGYGKFYVEMEALKEYEGLQTDLVSEDIAMALSLILFGMMTKMVEYEQKGWRTAANLIIYLNPSGFKYPSGQVEYQEILGRIFMRYMLNPNVPVHWKWGLMFNSWFYYKKPFVLAAIVTFTVIGLIRKWNAFIGLPAPAIWTMIGVFLAETINLSAMVRNIEKNGALKGFVLTIWLVIRNSPIFTIAIPSHVRGNLDGMIARAFFLPTGKDDSSIGTVTGEVPFATLYSRHVVQWQIRLGAALMTGLLLGMPNHPYILIAWLLYLAWVSANLAAGVILTAGPELWKTRTKIIMASWILLVGVVVFGGPWIAAVLFGTAMPLWFTLAFGWTNLILAMSFSRIARSVMWSYLRGSADVLKIALQPISDRVHRLRGTQKALSIGIALAAIGSMSIGFGVMWYLLPYVLFVIALYFLSSYINSLPIRAFETNGADPIGEWWKSLPKRGRIRAALSELIPFAPTSRNWEIKRIVSVGLFDKRLIALLSDSNAKVRREAASAIRTIAATIPADQTAGVINALVTATGDLDNGVATVAVDTLGVLSAGEASLPVLKTLMVSEQAVTRREGIMRLIALYNSGTSRAVARPEIIKALGSRDSAIRHLALQALGEVEVDEYIRILGEHVKATDALQMAEVFAYRDAIATRLIAITKEPKNSADDRMKALTAVLTDRDPYIAGIGLSALPFLKLEPSLGADLWIRVATSPNSRARYHALWALEKNQSSTDIVIALANDVRVNDELRRLLLKYLTTLPPPSTPPAASGATSVQPVNSIGSFVAAFVAFAMTGVVFWLATMIPVDWIISLGLPGYFLFVALFTAPTVFVGVFFGSQGIRLSTGLGRKTELLPAFAGPDVIDISKGIPYAKLSGFSPDEVKKIENAVAARRAAFVIRGTRFANKAALERLPLTLQASIWAHEGAHVGQYENNRRNWVSNEFFAYLAQARGFAGIIAAVLLSLVRVKATPAPTQADQTGERLARLRVAETSNDRAARITALLELFPTESLGLDQVSPAYPALGIYAAISDRAQSELAGADLDLVLRAIHAILLPGADSTKMKAGSLRSVISQFAESDPTILIVEGPEDLPRVQAMLTAMAAKGQREAPIVIAPEGADINMSSLKVPANVAPPQVLYRAAGEKLSDVLRRNKAMSDEDIATRFFHVLVSENYSLGTEFIDINPDRLQLLLLVLGAQVPVAVEIGAYQLNRLEETMRVIMAQA